MAIANDREWLLRTAVAHGWDIVAENGSSIIQRGDQRIEIEYGGGGLPRTIRYINGDTSIVLSQNYIRLTDVLEWIKKDAK